MEAVFISQIICIEELSRKCMIKYINMKSKGLFKIKKKDQVMKIV